MKTDTPFGTGGGMNLKNGLEAFGRKPTGEKILGSLGGMLSKTWNPKKNRPIRGPVITREPEKQLRHEKHYRYVSTHDVGYWARSFLQDLERTCRDHSKRRCWGIGFGLSFRVVALDPNFKKLSLERIVSAYKRTTTRAILLDYDGTLMPQASIDKSPSSKSIDIINSLCRDKNNMVFLVSARRRNTVAEWFSECEKLGLAAEHGYFLRLTRDAKWETCVHVADIAILEITVSKLETFVADVIREPDKDHFVEKLCHHPNWLSEEMVLCIRDIFLSLADSSKISSPECLASPSSPECLTP